MTLDLNDEGALIALMLDHGRCPAKIDRLAAEQVQEVAVLLAGSGQVELARRLIAVWRASAIAKADELTTLALRG
jgi:hypothetical protein